MNAVHGLPKKKRQKNNGGKIPTKYNPPKNAGKRRKKILCVLMLQDLKRKSSVEETVGV
jgi:hypothetical protein